MERQVVRVPARLRWLDRQQRTRTAVVQTCDLSEDGVYVDCAPAVSIPLFRLVYFEIMAGGAKVVAAPEWWGHDAVLSAVYRIAPPTAHHPSQGLALRFLMGRQYHAAAR
jgi:hypothetical protein